MITPLPGSEEKGRNFSCSVSSFSQGKITVNTLPSWIFLIERGQYSERKQLVRTSVLKVANEGALQVSHFIYSIVTILGSERGIGVFKGTNLCKV